MAGGEKQQQTLESAVTVQENTVSSIPIHSDYNIIIPIMEHTKVPNHICRATFPTPEYVDTPEELPTDVEVGGTRLEADDELVGCCTTDDDP